MAPEPDGKAPVQADGTERRLPAAPGSSALAAALVARGDAMVARRDIAAARLFYERAAAVDARAASALARTYDPAFLAEVGARGVQGDAALAAAWYRRAVALGDGGALARVEALNGPDRTADRRP
jgi:TPR repeat protein